MTAQTLTTEQMKAKWDAVFQRLTQAELLMNEYIDATDPLYRLEGEFLARNGLDQFKVRDFEQRKAFLTDNPAYAVPENINSHRDKLCSDFVELAAELMATPAPDLVSLRWKLKQTEDGDYTEEYCAQMWRDCDRLMCPAPEAAASEKAAA